MILGKARIALSQHIELNTTNTRFSQTFSFTIKEAWGALASLRYNFVPSCSSGCTASGGITSPLLNVGSSWSGTFTGYSVNAASTTSFSPNVTITLINPAGQPGGATTFTVNPDHPIRCDSQVGSYPGCVIPTVIPTLYISVAESGAAAHNILFAQTYLPDKWGKSKPLRRLADTGIQDTNRRAICDATFVPDPSVVGGDSCDEFAFAASYQSGNMLGVKGSSCAEIKPYIDQTTGTWMIAPAGRGWNGSERCVRGHVALADNTSVGSRLGSFTSAFRVLDYDEYWVSVID
ncbi:hypothetical protein [Actinoplanes aureus]|uniref:Uncharacterized protein n=1 Tax=Actinoplanes aureus TaxID=2792083 RepID=A0A931CKG1_9ACTN|nr:hypothetical protein [Actinoplanes aureus]MBG0568701.1 hypothetical protein [Actinoplanes aureus]